MDSAFHSINSCGEEADLDFTCRVQPITVVAPINSPRLSAKNSASSSHPIRCAICTGDQGRDGGFIFLREIDVMFPRR